MGTCVCGSTARLSTSRMTGQSLRNHPAPLSPCPTPLQPFPHPSRSDLWPRTRASLWQALCLFLPFSLLGGLWGITGIGWGDTQAQALGLSLSPGRSSPRGRVVSSCAHTQLAWFSISGQSPAGLPLSEVWPLSAGELSRVFLIKCGC